MSVGTAVIRSISTFTLPPKLPRRRLHSRLTIEVVVRSGGKFPLESESCRRTTRGDERGPGHHCSTSIVRRGPSLTRQTPHGPQCACCRLQTPPRTAAGALCTARRDRARKERPDCRYRRVECVAKTRCPSFLWPSTVIYSRAARAYTARGPAVATKSSAPAISSNSAREGREPPSHR